MGKTYDMEEVVIVVRGGVAELVRKSNNVRLIIRDYDVEGCEEDRLKKDKDGNEYIESVYDD